MVRLWKIKGRGDAVTERSGCQEFSAGGSGESFPSPLTQIRDMYTVQSRRPGT